jgi:hypothetical protein
MRTSYRAVLSAFLLIVLGFGLAVTLRDQDAMAQPVADGGAAGRFQISAFAGSSPQGVFHGCYVIDTTTGKVWHVRSGAGAPEKVTDKLE